MLKPEHAAGLRPALTGLVEHDYPLFHRALVIGEVVARQEFDESAFDVEAFLAADLAVASGGTVRFAFRCSRLGTDFLFTDRVDHVGTDRVLYLSDNESLLLAQSLPACRGARVLDAGTGSGVQSVAAFRRGASAVTSLDISPRAVEVARFNLALNGLPFEGVRRGDFSTHEFDAEFDLVVSDPPFVPVPAAVRFMTSGDGGEDGLDFLRLLLARCETLLARTGTLALVSISVGSLAFSELERLLVEYFYESPIRIDVQSIFPCPTPVQDVIEVFGDLSDAPAWQEMFRRRGFTHLHNLLITVSPAPRWRFGRSELARDLPAPVEHKGSVDWPGYLDEIRLARASARPQWAADVGQAETSGTRELHH